VFYGGGNRKDDSLRVLYHEGFHQYIYYSVGEMSPHSWFNEGNGDFFFGFNYEGGKWHRGTNSWRKDLAKKAKREHKFPDLWTWLHWSQAYYYGRNKSGVDIGSNYALGWDFVYFLRTTKKKEYQGILDRYFTTLKGFVTRARAAREAEEKARKDGPPAPPPAPTPPPADGKPPTPADPPANPPANPPAEPPAPPAPPPPAPSDPSDPPPEPPPVPPGPADEPPPVPPGPPDEPPPSDPPKPEDPPKPADPDKPAEPPKPADPTPPAPPTPQPPADPSKPADPAKPADPPKSGDPPKPADPAKPAAPPKPKTDDGIFNRQMWLDKALEEAFKGVDMKQLEKDWLNSD
jgi:hypothetical protein